MAVRRHRERAHDEIDHSPGRSTLADSMTLALQTHTRSAQNQGPQIRYVWDDWNVEAIEQPFDRKLYRRLRRLAYRATTAFTIANAEWVVSRYVTMLDDVTPLDYLEAVWAQTIDPLYGQEWDPLDAGWNGPVMGPIRQALMWAGNAVENTDEYVDSHDNAAAVVNIARHVLVDATAYEAWADAVLRRLEALYPLNKDDKQGDVVPREVFDPRFNFDQEMTETLLNEYLAALDPGRNPLLRPAEEMLAEGFEGTPYVFSMADDRRKRDEW